MASQNPDAPKPDLAPDHEPERVSVLAETQDPAPPRVTILICSACRNEAGSDARPRPGEMLADAARAANSHSDIAIETVDCLGNCKRRLSAAVITPGCWSYVFGDLDVANGADLVEGAALMRSSVDGLMPWRGRPQCMKKGMVARLPPLDKVARLPPLDKVARLPSLDKAARLPPANNAAGLAAPKRSTTK